MLTLTGTTFTVFINVVQHVCMLTVAIKHKAQLAFSFASIWSETNQKKLKL